MTNSNAELLRLKLNLLRERQRRANLWRPFPGPQTWAYESDADVLGYGGAAGGGKTDLLLGLACMRHQRSLLLRREAKQGRGVIDRAREVFGTLGRFNENTGVWRDLPGGRQIEFGGCKDPGDEQAHKGRPKDLLAIDEADQFAEPVVRFLMGWVRTTDQRQSCRTVLAFNPPSTVEGRWLLSFFGPWIDKRHPRPAAPGELRWYARLKDGTEVERPDGTPFDDRGETVAPKSRTFIPARVQDNPALMGTGYLSTLLALPEPLRSQLAYGDMSAGLEDDPWQIIPTAWVEQAMARWTPEGHMNVPLSAIGVDVARGGKAQTVLARRRGVWFAPLEKHPGKSTPDGPAVVRLIDRALLDNRQALVVIDANGIGASVYDECAGNGWWAMAYMGSAGVDATDASGVLTFSNQRAYSYWSMREMLDPSKGHNLQLPPDPELLADLTAAKWERRGGRIFLESKDKLAEPDRLGRSTDCGDAIVQSILMPAHAGTQRGPDTLRA